MTDNRMQMPRRRRRSSARSCARGQADSCIESLGTKVRFALSPAAWVPSLAPLNWPRDTQIPFFGPYGWARVNARSWV